MADLILVRGLPGSGKSTFAQDFAYDYVRLEADMWFTDHLGNYNWNAINIRQAHAWCLETARILLNNGQSVVVSNTFTTLKEMQPYIDHAKLLDIEVRVYRMTKNYGSIHNVPDEAIKRMVDRFQGYPGETLIGEE